ncbi:carbohydrate-binding protein [Salinibius halmophilus]|uniref:carbohydrate-binding protein n=1 Tax=Salinibius halmophilus TaxID=1853216 RepID=UPI000E6664C0|nr:carbohydrate-binding protein [Salinibius halmophilus]
MTANFAKPTQHHLSARNIAVQHPTYWQPDRAYPSGTVVRFNGQYWQARLWNINNEPNEHPQSLWTVVTKN